MLSNWESRNENWKWKENENGKCFKTSMLRQPLVQLYSSGKNVIPVFKCSNL